MRFLPRSFNGKTTYFPGFHFFSNSSLRHFAVCENRCISKRWTLFFQRTPLQHFRPALNIARSFRRCSRFALRRWYLASCRSSLVIIFVTSRGCGVGCVLSRFDRAHETGYAHSPPCKKRPCTIVKEQFWNFFREIISPFASVGSHKVTFFDFLPSQGECEIRRHRPRIVCIVIVRATARPHTAEIVVIIVIGGARPPHSRAANIQRCTHRKELTLFCPILTRLSGACSLCR